MATGLDLMDGKKTLEGGSLRVAYINGEENQDELDRRFAAICQRYGLKPEDYQGRIRIISTRDKPLRLAKALGDFGSTPFTWPPSRVRDHAAGLTATLQTQSGYDDPEVHRLKQAAADLIDLYQASPSSLNGGSAWSPWLRRRSKRLPCGP